LPTAYALLNDLGYAAMAAVFAEAIAGRQELGRPAVSA
jgi:hypothetical protein